MHQKAKEIIKEKGFIYVRDLSDNEMKIVRFEDIQLEVKVGQFSADLLGTHISGRQLLMEIAVTHPCEQEKIQYYQETGRDSVEIALADLADDYSLRELEDQVLKTAPRKWIYNSKYDLSEKEMGGNETGQRPKICEKLLKILRALKKVLTA